MFHCCRARVRSRTWKYNVISSLCCYTENVAPDERAKRRERCINFLTFPYLTLTLDREAWFNPGLTPGMQNQVHRRLSSHRHQETKKLLESYMYWPQMLPTVLVTKWAWVNLLIFIPLNSVTWKRSMLTPSHDWWNPRCTAWSMLVLDAGHHKWLWQVGVAPKTIWQQISLCHNAPSTFQKCSSTKTGRN